MIISNAYWTILPLITQQITLIYAMLVSCILVSVILNANNNCQWILLFAGGYFMTIFNDYRSACRDVIQGTKEAPKRAAVYLSMIVTAAVFTKTNPTENSFNVQLSEGHHDLLLLGQPIRNRHSDAHIKSLQQNKTEGTLRYTNCGIFSIMWLCSHHSHVDRYDAQCSLVKPRWKDFHQQIVDVGLLGRWHSLQSAMHDYDVNPDEWEHTNTC